MNIYLLLDAIVAVILVVAVIIFVVHNQRRPLYKFKDLEKPELESQAKFKFNFNLPKFKFNFNWPQINLPFFQAVTAVLSLFFLLVAAVKEVGSPWLMLSGLFFLLYLALRRVNSFKQRYKRRKVSKIIKLAFSHSFWLWGFIFLSGLWLIFFVIH